MRFTLRVSPFAPVGKVAEFVRRCEAAGLDGVGILDSPLINREQFVCMALAAASTERIGLATAVANPVTRHVSVLASAAVSLDDLAPGRIEIWLGRGSSATSLAGLREASTAALRRAVVDLRRLLAGEWDVFPGAHSRLHAAGPRVPVFLAAAGPRTIRLAGEVADGLLVSTGFVPSALERARELVAQGARAAGRRPEEVRIRVNLLTAIRDTREEALRWAGPMLALRLQQPAWLEQAGIDPGPVQAPSGLSGLYPDPMHPEDHEAAMDIAEQIPLELREQIAAASGLIGTPEDCLSRLQALHELGFDDVFLRSVDTVSFPEPEARLFGTKLRPALVERGLVG